MTSLIHRKAFYKGSSDHPDHSLQRARFLYYKVNTCIQCLALPRCIDHAVLVLTGLVVQGWRNGNTLKFVSFELSRSFGEAVCYGIQSVHPVHATSRSFHGFITNLRLWQVYVMCEILVFLFYHVKFLYWLELYKLVLNLW